MELVYSDVSLTCLMSHDEYTNDAAEFNGNRMSRRYDIQDPTSQHTGKEPGVIDAARTTIENMVS